MEIMIDREELFKTLVVFHILLGPDTALYIPSKSEGVNILFSVALVARANDRWCC